MDIAKPKIWTKDFNMAFATNFFVFIAFYLLMTTLTVYAINQFNASESKAGLATSIFIIGSLIFRFLTGIFIEFIGRKKMLLCGLVLFLIASLLYFAVESLNLLLLVRFIHGAAFGVASTAVTTFATAIIPGERRGEGISYYSLSITLATAIGPFIGLFLSQHASFTMIFVVCTIFSVLSILLSLFSHIPEVVLTKEQLADMKGLKLKDLFEISAIPISIITAIICVAYSGILAFLAAFTIEIKLLDAASFFFIVYAVVIFISRPFAGRLLDKKGDNFVIYPALIIFSLSLVLLSQAQHGLTILLAGALAGLGFGTFISCAQAISVKNAPKHRIGLATSTFFIFSDAGMGIGPYLIGFFVPLFGYRGLYGALAVIVFASILLYYLLHGRKAAYIKPNVIEDSPLKDISNIF